MTKISAHFYCISILYQSMYGKCIVRLTKRRTSGMGCQGKHFKGSYIWIGLESYQRLTISVGTLLIFQFSPGFRTVALVPPVPRYRFWHFGSGSYVSISWCWYKVFSKLFAFFLYGTGSIPFWYHFGSISTPNQVKPKALVLEPKLTGTLSAQNFRYQNKEAAVLSVFLVLDQHY